MGIFEVNNLKLKYETLYHLIGNKPSPFDKMLDTFNVNWFLRDVCAPFFRIDFDKAVDIQEKLQLEFDIENEEDFFTEGL